LPRYYGEKLPTSQENPVIFFSIIFRNITMPMSKKNHKIFPHNNGAKKSKFFPQNFKSFLTFQMKNEKSHNIPNYFFMKSISARNPCLVISEQSG
jgi:hypothetical protein